MGLLAVGSWLFLQLFLVPIAVVPMSEETRVARERLGIGRAAGWTLYAVWVVGGGIPLLLGAGGERAILESFVGVVPFTLGLVGVGVAAANYRDYATIRGARDRRTERIAPEDDGPVVVSGTVREVAGEAFGPWERDLANHAWEEDPFDGAGDEERNTNAWEGSDLPLSPFLGVEAVAVDWSYKELRWSAGGKRWRIEGNGSLSIPFVLSAAGESVVVDPSGAELLAPRTKVTIPSEKRVPPLAAAFMAHRDDLPDPDERQHDCRFQETVVATDHEVAVIGYPSRELPSETSDRPEVEPGFATGETVVGASADGTDAPLVVAGGYDEAVRRLRRRVVWAGLAGVPLVVAGQGLALLLTSAAVPGL